MKGVINQVNLLNLLILFLPPQSVNDAEFSSFVVQLLSDIFFRSLRSWSTLAFNSLSCPVLIDSSDNIVYII